MKIKSAITIGAMSLFIAGGVAYAQTSTPTLNKDTGARRAAEVKKAAEVRHAEVKKAVEARKTDIKQAVETKKADAKKTIEIKKAESRKKTETKKLGKKALQPSATSTVSQ